MSGTKGSLKDIVQNTRKKTKKSRKSIQKDIKKKANKIDKSIHEIVVKTFLNIEKREESRTFQKVREKNFENVEEITNKWKK